MRWVIAGGLLVYLSEYRLRFKNAVAPEFGDIVQNVRWYDRMNAISADGEDSTNRQGLIKENNAHNVNMGSFSYLIVGYIVCSRCSRRSR